MKHNKYLVISAIGAKSLHSVWITPERHFDVALINYESDLRDAVEHEPGVEEFFHKGAKFELVQWYIDNFGNNYDYYLLLDDDMLAQTSDINQLFGIVEQFGIHIGHPSVNLQNITSPAMAPADNSVIRYTNWIELQAVVINKEQMYNLKDYFTENKSGWGFPELWLSLTEKPFAIIDSVTFTHTRPQFSDPRGVYSLTDGKVGAWQEYTDLLNKYKLQPAAKEHFTVYHQIEETPTLSVVCIYNRDDMPYLPAMLKSISELEDWAEVILMETVADYNIDKPYVKVLKRNNNKVKAVYHYIPSIVNFDNDEIEIFDFSEARNAALELAKGEWILSIDADERLIPTQLTELKEQLKETPETVGGYTTAQYNFLPWSTNEDGSRVRALAMACRLFRNDPMIYWEYPVHEMVENTIREAGYDIAEMSLLVDHLGQTIPAKEKLVKIKKYLATIWNDKSLMEHSRYVNYMINSSILYRQLQEL